MALVVLRLALLLAPALAGNASLSFLLIGDWGGFSDFRPATRGESDCAVGMGRVAERLGASFVLGLGDNIYITGVHAWNKWRFNSTFESVFTADSLNVDWYMVAGNHDHLGNIQYQIDYSSQSKRWKFPAAFYTFQRTLPSGKVAEFVMFDSVTLAGMSYHDEATDTFVAAQGPANATAAESQWDWLEKQLAGSKADYLFLAAHYPVWSVCAHGSTSSLVSRLRPLMTKYEVTAHLAGHDHCLNHIEEDNNVFVLSGAGALAWYSASNMDHIGSARLKWHMAKDNKQHFTGGFAAITLTDEAASVLYYGNDGTQVFAADPKPPRSRSGRGREEAVIAV
uniref:acid phosphatase n=1 Tax=Alexandrium monilatum TaxID=311494 RepID=A0A7S4SFD4_9DINO|mmetsp:Transcript_8517/g.25834  ORF Transcript_8517/g.25834 Transcript_8517/m.25834 type:complete len:338 (-) Transcript_8517:134-1147(-)